MKKIRELIFPISFRFLIIVFFLLLVYISLLFSSKFLLDNFNSQLIAKRRLEIKNQALILSDRISNELYLNKKEVNNNIDSQIETLADIFDGRVAIIDSNFSVIKDTFSLSLGKKSVAKEVIKTFRGETVDTYIPKKDYIIQTFPIYKQGEDEIEGVILITSSTEDFNIILQTVKENTIIFNVLLLVISLIFIYVFSKYVSKPFIILEESIRRVLEGDFDYHIVENTYGLTKNISSAINVSLDRLRNINKVQEEFVENVSHELKTPITSIKVLADTLTSMGEVDIEIYKEFLSDISYEIDRENKIIDDLLALIRVDNQDDKFITENKNINHQINLVLKRLRPLAENKNIALVFESVREVEAEIDETKFSIALSNLVENAIKYNEEEGNVKVILDADHKFLYIKVIDDGIGIPEDAQELIFDRFYRVDKARSRETGGTGLGLAITKSFIMKHGGIIRVNSKEKEGTTFIVRMPLKQKIKGV